MEGESEFTSYLHDNGLDNADYWVSQMAKQGVHSKSSLQLLEGDKNFYNKLKKATKHQVQRLALQKLLKIDQKNNKGKEKASDKDDQKRLELHQFQHEDGLFEFLDEPGAQGKENHDRKIKMLEDDLCKALGISPESCPDILINRMKEYHNISGQLEAREPLSKSMLLQKVSGGRALQGIFLTKRTEDLFDDRSQLLEAPDNVVITEALLSEDKTIQFSSAHEENSYKKTVDVLGISIAVSASALVYGSVTVDVVTPISVGTSVSDRTEDEETHKQHKKETYSSTVKYSTFQVASFSFENKDLKLSKDAKEGLNNILQILSTEGASSTKTQEVCEKFFHTYGSHVNRGPLCFGGNFRWTCTSKGFTQSEAEMVKKMQNEVISAMPGISFAGFGVKSDKIKESYQGKCSDDTLASTCLQVKISGGPPEATDLPLWKSGLMANNSTWNLIDRGKKLMPVWDIIRENHEKDLGKVREILQNTWEKISRSKAEEELTYNLHDLKSVLQEVSVWSKEESFAPQQIQDKLEYLIKVKEDIFSKLANPNIWINQYLSQPSLQTFLESVVDSGLEPQYNKNIKLLMQRLVTQEDLAQHTTQSFPAIEKVIKWLYKSYEQPKSSGNILDFQSFVNLLEEILQDARLASSGLDIPRAKIAQHVAMGIHSLRSNIKGGYEDIFITILVYPFQNSNFNDDVITLKPFTMNGLKSLSESFSKQKLKFNEYLERKHQLQAYLFYLAVDLCCDTKRSLLQQFLQEILSVMKKLQPPLEHELLEELDTYIGCDWYTLSDFKESLQSLMISPLSINHLNPPPAWENGKSCSLNHALETATYQALYEHHSLSVLKNNPTAHKLFEMLGISKFYTKRLILRDALHIRSESLNFSLSDVNPTDPKQLLMLVLHKLMANDYTCRSDLMLSNTVKGECDFDYGDYNDDGDDKEGNKSNEIHPVDSLLALILCSDYFLRQDLFFRLAICQLAVPFILPDPFSKKLFFPVWAMRSIIKDWKCTQGTKIVQITQPIVTYRMPVISFIRFGKHGKSKSQILNEVISESHYDHFSHHDLPGGQYNCLLGDGLVDMCWYLPAGKSTDAFPDAVTFLNLHGDASRHIQQSRFLSKISSMCFILLTEEDMEFDKTTMDILKTFSSSAGGITVLNDVDKKPEFLKKEIPSAVLIKLSNKNSSEIKQVIRLHINKKLSSNVEKYLTIEEMCMIKEEGIFVDEESDFFQEGLSLANEVKYAITSHTVKKPGVKEAMIPLQGEDLWQRWATEDKELHRQIHRGSEEVDMYTAKIERKKTVLREKQLKHVESLSPVMESFIVSLLKLEGSSNRHLRSYFLQCLKLELNNLSRASITGMQHQYQSIRREYNLAKLQAKEDKTNVKSDSGQLKELKGKMQVLQEDIINASFGLEHIFRELGQMYEAAVLSQHHGEDLSRLPKAAAELLIDGHPLEIMDGDAAHVPLEWITAVFNEAVKMLGDPKVFVLSVLGLQSTGKSTMLNAVFGLQFNVSAGRCTRGAFLQLLSLDEELQRETECSYVLVVDTEGLRAPELDPLKTQKHDNELATFVIGLADMTLINIYGEVPGDMDDILQTSVHAFLRMNQVKCNPSCQFIHQNASTNLNSEIGRAKFTQKLNQFTLDASKAEKCEGQFETFNDVIKFDDQTDVHHFPGLWKGDPPMAPVNQGYSQQAQLLKQHFIKILHERASMVGSLSSFYGKVGDLWKTLLKENFVFSFKNTLEITAYNSLETAYSTWDWTFQEGMLIWEHKTENIITTAPVHEVADLVEKKKLELVTHANTVFYEPLKLKMDTFFKGKQSEILAQWRMKFETRFDHLSTELQEHARNHCIKLGKSREAISKIEKERKEYSQKITKGVQDYIASIKREREKLNQNLKKGKLEASQLQAIIQQNLFAPGIRSKYREQKIITQYQESRINAKILECGGQLTEDCLSSILVGGILDIEDIMKILKRGLKTEKELKHKFQEIWIDLINTIPLVSGGDTPVRVEVQNKLMDFVQAEGYAGQLVGELQKTPLMERCSNLEFLPEETTHYDIIKTSSWRNKLEQIYTYIIFTAQGKKVEVDRYRKEALEITKRVLNTVRSDMESILEKYKDTDFNTAFIQDILRKLSYEIAGESAASHEHFNFNLKYRLEVYLTACAYAIPKFQKMRDSFSDRRNPRLYLERHLKDPLYTRFKNQYYQTEAEEAIANTLCAHLTEPIKTQIGKLIGAKMVAQMRGSQPYFSSKIALKVKILKDLHEKENFESYMVYVTDVKRYLQGRIEFYTIEFCDKIVSNRSTRLQITAKEEVTRLVSIIENKLTYMDETDIYKWMSAFCKDEDIRSELGASLEAVDLLTGYDSLQDLNCENFKTQIKIGLKELEKKLHSSFNRIKCRSEMANWKDKPHDLLRKLIGCTAQCPFCGEQCDLIEPDHIENGGPKHTISVHRSNCLRGWHLPDTKLMVTGFCPAYISGQEKYKSFQTSSTEYESHPYMEYQEVYPDWSIVPDVSSKDSLYWKLFVGKNIDKIADHYNLKAPTVPSDWANIQWEDVVKNFKELYNC